MAVWPFLMATAAGLTLWGWSRDAAIIPALALVGYIGMRGIIWGMPPAYHEVAGCTWWLIIAALMAMSGGHVAALFLTLSAMVYPVFMALGYRMEFLGLSPIVSEVFAVCALISIGGGIYGISLGDSAVRSSGHSFGRDLDKNPIPVRQTAHSRVGSEGEAG